jgi:putative ABC transport system substrate-binding protein
VLFGTYAVPLGQLAMKHRLPSIHGARSNVEAGGLLLYGPNIPYTVRQATVYVYRILRGAKPGELPVQQPTKLNLVINLKTAKALGLTIPPSLLLRADQIIE